MSAGFGFRGFGLARTLALAAAAAPATLIAATAYSATGLTDWTPLSSVSVNAGELLVFVATQRFGGTHTTASSGWNKYDQQDTANAFSSCFYATASGSTTSLTINCGTSGNWTGILFRFSVGATLAGGVVNATADPSNYNPAVSRAYVWLTTISAIAGSGAIAVTTTPTGYSSMLQAGGSAGDAGLTAGAVKSATASSEDPSTWATDTGIQSISRTLGIY